MVNVRKVYEAAYQNDRPNRKEIRITGWPKDRHQACIFWAGTGERVLDVGCGNGVVLYNLQEHFRELHGTEFAFSRVISARETLKDLPAYVIQNNIEDGLPYPDTYFDTVISAATIEHVVDVLYALKEMYRVLKPGGRLLLITPNVAKLTNRLRLLLGKFPSTSFDNEGVNFTHANVLMDGGHFHYFTYRSMRLFCQQAGFKPIYSYGIGTFGRLHQLWPKLLSGNIVLLAYRQKQ